MDSDRHARVADLFARAVELAPAERAPFLARECGADEDLRREVESLLSHHVTESPSQLFGWKPGLTREDSGEESMAGRTVGRFQIVDEIGRGGMGVVWRADDPVLGRRVAIKFLPPRLAQSPEAREQFVREARAASALDHPGVATIYDFGEFEGRFFIALRLVEGDTVARRLAASPLPVATALRVAIDVARALEHAHERRVLHRDVSASNIIVTPDGHGVLLDFGLAASIGAVRESTQRGGTPSYIAPEVVAGNAPDERSDVFALGVVLYEMLTGRNPFPRSARVHWLRGETVEAPLNPSEIVHGPRKLDDVVLHALDPDPQKRTSSASVLATQLENIATSLEPKRRSTRTVVAAIAAIVVLAFVATQIFDRGEVEAVADPELAVWTVTGPDSLQTTSLEGLLQLGLSENTSARVMSPERVNALRARAAKEGRSDDPIGLARSAGATALLLAETVDDAESTIEWKLVETRKGHTMDRGRVGSHDLMGAVDVIVRTIIPEVAAHSGTRTTDEVRPVAEMTTSSPQAYQLYIRSFEPWYQSKHDTAMADLKAAVALDSTFALASYTLSKAFEEFDRASKETKAFANLAWRHRSRLSFRDRLRLEAWRDRLASSPATAMEIYEELLSRWPDDREALKEIVQAKWWYWQWSESLRYAAIGNKLYPDDMFFAKMHVVNLYFADRGAEAVPLARSRIAVEPCNDSWDDLAQCFIRMGMLDSATVAFQTAMRIDPDPLKYAEGMAKIAYYQGDLERAIAISESLVVAANYSTWERFSMQINPYYGVAGLYVEAGRFQDAIDRVDDACRGVAGIVPLYGRISELSWYLYLAGRYEEAVALLVEYRQSDEFRTDPHAAKRSTAVSEIYSLIALGRLDEARRHLEVFAGGILGKGTYYHQGYARIALAEGRPVFALDHFTKAVAYGLSEGPMDIGCNKLCADAYIAMGRLVEAEIAWRHLVRRYPSHGIGHYYLAQLMEQNGKRDEAKDQYRVFLKKWSRADRGLPELADAKARLATLERQ